MTGSAPGVGRLNWNGSGEGEITASIWTSGWSSTSKMTAVGVASPTSAEEQAVKININKKAVRCLEFI